MLILCHGDAQMRSNHGPCWTSMHDDLAGWRTVDIETRVWPEWSIRIRFRGGLGGR